MKDIEQVGVNHRQRSRRAWD